MRHLVVAGLLGPPWIAILLCHRSSELEPGSSTSGRPSRHGHVENRETLPRARSRCEFHEELGIVILEPAELDAVRVVTSEYDLSVWVIGQWAGQPGNAAPREHDEVSWFSLGQVSSLHLADSSYLDLLTNALASPRRAGARPASRGTATVVFVTTEPPVRYRSPDEDSARWWHFPFRPGDIVISTRSKSGTTWMQMICALLVFQTPAFPQPLADLSPWLDWLITPEAEVYARLAAQRHRRIIKTHTPLDGLPIDPGVTYIVVARDPLDPGRVSLFPPEDVQPQPAPDPPAHRPVPRRRPPKSRRRRRPCTSGWWRGSTGMARPPSTWIHCPG